MRTDLGRLDVAEILQIRPSLGGGRVARIGPQCPGSDTRTLSWQPFANVRAQGDTSKHQDSDVVLDYIRFEDSRLN